MRAGCREDRGGGGVDPFEQQGGVDWDVGMQSRREVEGPEANAARGGAGAGTKFAGQAVDDQQAVREQGGIERGLDPVHLGSQ